MIAGDLTSLFDMPAAATRGRALPAAKLPLVVSYGAGVDSTAMLVGMHQRGERPDVILFADTGAEMPGTYDYLPIIDAWLASVGFPALTIVRNACPRAKHVSIFANCETNETLPGQAFRGGQPGGGNCSARWKHEPMDRWLYRAGYLARTRCIGYDAGKRDSKRAAKGSPEATKHKRDTFRYPLQEWGWDRERCEREIAAAGLPVPPKSSCYICPAMKPEELRTMARKHPALLRNAIRLEGVARAGRHGLRTVKGLGRKFAWGDMAREEGLLAEYGGPAVAPDATSGPSPEASAFLTARTILV